MATLLLRVPFLIVAVALSETPPLYRRCSISHDPSIAKATSLPNLNKNVTKTSCPFQSQTPVCGCQGSRCKFIIGSSNNGQVHPHAECQTVGYYLIVPTKDVLKRRARVVPLGKKLGPFVCNICANPVPDIIWKAKGGISSRAKCRMNERGFAELVLPNATEDNAYACVATNVVGTITLEKNDWNVTVESQKIEPTHSNPAIASQKGNPITTPIIACGTFLCVIFLTGMILRCAIIKRRRHVEGSIPMGVEDSQPFLDSANVVCSNDITIYVSYDDDHAQFARALAASLRMKHGFDCRLFDFYEHEAAVASVPEWMVREIAKADAIVVVCSAIYKKIVEGEDVDSRRTRAEWNYIQARLYSEGTNCCVPVFVTSSSGGLPLPLETADPLTWPDEENRLVRRLQKFGQENASKSIKNEEETNFAY